MSSTASTPLADLTADEHAQSKLLAFLKSLVRGGGVEPPYEYEQAYSDFCQAVGEVVFQRSFNPAASTAGTMEYPDVKHLYIYRPPNEFTTKILADMKLWASKPSAFNDPFDCDLDVAGRITETDVLYAATAEHGQRTQWPAQVSQYFDSLFDGNGQFTLAERARLDREIEMLIEENKNSGVICLTEVNDSILMWSHYACNHTGICIEFERTPNNALGDIGIATPINYRSVYPHIDLGKMLVHRDGQTLDLMLRYKADCWSYEKEWRVFRDHGNAPSPLVGRITKNLSENRPQRGGQAHFAPRAPQNEPVPDGFRIGSKVIFGLRTPTPFRQVIQSWCDARGIHTVQAAKLNRAFKLDIPN
jgi:hypothetical protein